MNYLALNEQQALSTRYASLRGNETAGFTVNNQLQDWTGGGFGVAVSPQYEARIPERFLTLQLFEALVLGYLDNIGENQFIGCWYSNGFYYFDVSEVFTDIDDAIEAGNERRQKAIFDFSNGVSLYL